MPIQNQNTIHINNDLILFISWNITNRSIIHFLSSRFYPLSRQETVPGLL